MTSTTFEALFVRGLKVKGPAAEALRAVGFDIDRIKPSYPVSIWKASVETAAKQLYPDLGFDQALRKLGHVMVEGFFETLVGKVMCAGMSLIGPERYLKRFPELAKMEKRRLTITPVEEGDRRWRMNFDGEPHLMAEFLAGIIEAGVTRTKVTPTVRVEHHRPGVFDVCVSW